MNVFQESHISLYTLANVLYMVLYMPLVPFNSNLKYIMHTFYVHFPKNVNYQLLPFILLHPFKVCSWFYEIFLSWSSIFPYLFFNILDYSNCFGWENTIFIVFQHGKTWLQSAIFSQFEFSAFLAKSKWISVIKYCSKALQTPTE